MAQKLLVDTWGWITLRNEKEKKHKETNRYFKHFVQRKGLIYTTDYILDETFTLLFRRLPPNKAKESVTIILDSIIKGFLILERVSEDRFKKAISLRLSYADKPDISFTDLTSFVIMREMEISEILTSDKHFSQSGFFMSEF